MSKVLVDQEWLKRLHRDLDACQKVIWLGLRGADPAYCQDAQDRLKEIDELLAQPAEAEGVVELGSDAWMALHLLDRLDVSADEDPRVQQVEEIVRRMGAALSAVTAERDRLREALGEKALCAAYAERQKLRAEVDELRKDADRWNYVRLQGDDMHWLNLLRVDPEDFGGNINAVVDALIDGDTPAMAAKEA